MITKSTKTRIERVIRDQFYELMESITEYNRTTVYERLQSLTALARGLYIQSIISKETLQYCVEDTEGVGKTLEIKQPTIEFINHSGLEFTDISSEKFRTYKMPSGEILIIKRPLWLNVSDSGGHRIFDASGTSWYIQPKENWHMSWKAAPGKPNFVK